MKSTSPVYWTMIRLETVPEDLTWLSSPEQTRLQQYRFPKRALDWLSGRWAAKSLVAGILFGNAPYELSELSILNEASGAPFVEWQGKRKPGSLSISHRGEYAVAAYCYDPDISIGIDLELIEPKSQGFVQDYFTAQEANRVFGLPAQQQALAASLLWSGREALLKALQLGLRIDTRQIALGIPDLNAEDDWQPLKIRQCPPEAAHLQLFWKRVDQAVLTLAIKQKHPDLEISPDRLIQIL